MIDVRVRKQYELYPCGVESEPRAILSIGVGAALEHAAVDQKRALAGCGPNSTSR